MKACRCRKASCIGACQGSMENRRVKAPTAAHFLCLVFHVWHRPGHELSCSFKRIQVDTEPVGCRWRLRDDKRHGDTLNGSCLFDEAVLIELGDDALHKRSLLGWAPALFCTKRSSVIDQFAFHWVNYCRWSWVE